VQARLLERSGLTQLLSSLRDPNLTAQQLTEDLFQHLSVTERPERLGLQEKAALIFTDDRRNDKAAFVAGQFEGASYRGPLAHVEHAPQPTSSPVPTSSAGWDPVPACRADSHEAEQITRFGTALSSDLGRPVASQIG